MTEIIIPQQEIVDINSLQVDGNNPNRLRAEQREALKENMKKFGFIVPIITNKDGLISDGQHKWEIAQELGMTQVPIIRLPVSEVDRRILRQILNKLKGTHDSVLDDNEYKFIFRNESFDELQRLLGDSDRKLVSFLASLEKDKLTEDNLDIDGALQKPAYSIELGEVWSLGSHKLMCGDSTKKMDVEKLMMGSLANMAFTDPPYNVNYDQDKSPQGKPSNSQGKILNDALSSKDFKQFLHSALENLLSFTTGGIYVCMGCKEWPTIMETFQSLSGHWSSTIIWNKKNFVLGHQDYHRQFEPILYGWKEGNTRFFIDDRTVADVWEIQKPNKNELHPTQKPVELPGIAISNSSKEGDTILDLFGGSGSTLIACEQLKRKCYMMELDPRFCSVIIERWEKITNGKAVRI